MPVSRRAASCRSAGLTMWYRSNTERVLWPVTSMATRSETPESTKFRTAVRRKSCLSIGQTLARRQAPCHARRKSDPRPPVPPPEVREKMRNDPPKLPLEGPHMLNLGHNEYLEVGRQVDLCLPFTPSASSTLNGRPA